MHFFNDKWDRIYMQNQTFYIYLNISFKIQFFYPALLSWSWCITNKWLKYDDNNNYYNFPASLAKLLKVSSDLISSSMRTADWIMSTAWHMLTVFAWSIAFGGWSTVSTLTTTAAINEKKRGLLAQQLQHWSFDLSVSVKRVRPVMLVLTSIAGLFRCFNYFGSVSIITLADSRCPVQRCSKTRLSLCPW